jgi:hypothetical protein
VAAGSKQLPGADLVAVQGLDTAPAQGLPEPPIEPLGKRLETPWTAGEAKLAGDAFAVSAP